MIELQPLNPKYFDYLCMPGFAIFPFGSHC